MVASRSARFNVVAEYRDLTSARGAIQAPTLRGVEAASIGLSGPGARAAEAESVADTARADQRMATRMFRRTLTGMIVGLAIACVFAGISVIIALAAGAGTGIYIGITFMAAALTGIVVGALLTGAVSLTVSPNDDATYADDAPGEAFVSFHAHQPGDIERVEKILRNTYPLRVRRYESSA